MIIPETEPRKSEYLAWVLSVCRQSARDRHDLYDRRRRYFLYGTDADGEVMYNRIESHLDLVSAFLFSGDQAQFSLAAPLNSDDAVVKQFMAAEDCFNRDFRDAGLFDVFGDAMPWALCFDSMLLKAGWSDTRGEASCTIVEPWKFGVFAEEITELENQQAFCHTYHIDYDQACQRLERAGLGDRIKTLAVVNTPFESPFPETITRMIIASTGGENLGGNVTGSANPTYIPRPTYQPTVDRPMVPFHELYVWDEDCNDYRVFFMIEPDMLISDSRATIDVLKKSGDFARVREQQQAFYNTSSNPFFPKEHPFIQVRPYQVYEYFWGKAHIDSLIPLQNWSNERLEQIHDILDRQAYPPRVGSGFMGLSDEKMEAFGGADTWVMDQLPNAQIKELYPQMPTDIFTDYDKIGGLFMEASGLTEVVQGKGTAGVRSKEHAKQLASTGSGRIKKTAVRLEAPLVRMGDLFLKLNQRNNSEEIVPDPKEDGHPGDPFYYANLGEDYSLRISGHSHSPLFTDDTKELAGALFKAGAVDREMLVRMLNPPQRDPIIHSLRARMKKEAQAKMMGLEQGGDDKKGHHPKPRAVG